MQLSGLPLYQTCAKPDLCPALAGRAEKLFPVTPLGYAETLT